MIHDIPKIVKHKNTCEICMKGNKPRLPFAPEVSPRAKHALRVMHSDVCGPFEVPSLGGNKYFVSFMDGFTGMTWVTLINFKHGVFVEF